MVAKDYLWSHFEKKYGRDVAKNYLPETYVLRNNSHMKIFKQNFIVDL